jgi:hypothetical protein
LDKELFSNVQEILANPSSRRLFLKGAGVLSMGVVASSVVIPASVASALSSSKADLEKARKIATRSELLAQAETELSNLGYTVKLDVANSGELIRSSEHEGLAGFSLPTPDFSKESAKVSVTVTTDLNTKVVTAVHYQVAKFVATENEGSGEVRSVTLSGSQRQKQEKIVKHMLPPRPESAITTFSCTPYVPFIRLFYYDWLPFECFLGFCGLFLYCESNTWCRKYQRCYYEANCSTLTCTEVQECERRYNPC